MEWSIKPQKFRTFSQGLWNFFLEYFTKILLWKTLQKAPQKAPKVPTSKPCFFSFFHLFFLKLDCKTRQIKKKRLCQLDSTCVTTIPNESKSSFDYLSNLLHQISLMLSNKLSVEWCRWWRLKTRDPSHDAQLTGEERKLIHLRNIFFYSYIVFADGLPRFFLLWYHRLLSFPTWLSYELAQVLVRIRLKSFHCGIFLLFSVSHVLEYALRCFPTFVTVSIAEKTDKKWNPK